MATATETKTSAPRKRVAKKAAATPESTNTAPKRRGRPPKAATPVEDEETFEESPKGPTKAEIDAEERAQRKQERRDEYEEAVARVVELRSTDPVTGWDEISEELGVHPGVALKMLYWHEARQEDNYELEVPTPEAVAELRDAGWSWPRIEVKYDITRGKAWKLYGEAMGDEEAHFSSDIGKGGRYVERDPEEVAARRAARASSKPATNGAGAAPKRRGRKAAFKGFTDETPEEDILNAVEGNKITWNLTRGDGTDSAIPKPGTVQIVTDKRNQRGIKFNDGRKSRTVYVNKVIAIG